jgi:hypothetical protein
MRAATQSAPAQRIHPVFAECVAKPFSGGVEMNRIFNPSAGSFCQAGGDPDCFQRVSPVHAIDMGFVASAHYPDRK